MTGPSSQAGPIDRLVERVLADDPGIARHRLRARAVEAFPLADHATVERAVDGVVGRSGGLGRLDAVLALPGVDEVMVHGSGAVWIERDGRLERTDVELDRSELDVAIERILRPLGRQADRLHPLVDARLDDGSRVNVAVPPVAIDGPTLTIRRFAASAIPIEAFGAEAAVDHLAAAVDGRRSILVVGGTGAGKTTLLNAIGALLEPGERIVTVEDTAELRFPGEHVVRLETRPASREGSGLVTLRDLVRNALRMRPDRLVVGEVRGGEALDLLLALTTGHAGSLATLHADDAESALRRLAVLALLGGVDLGIEATRELVHDAVDLVVVVRRTGQRRQVVGIGEVVGVDRVEPVWAIDGALA